MNNLAHSDSLPFTGKDRTIKARDQTPNLALNHSDNRSVGGSRRPYGYEPCELPDCSTLLKRVLRLVGWGHWWLAADRAAQSMIGGAIGQP
jgi:hypothetical protein